MTTCLHCGATNSNGLALCELCQRFARECLSHLPTYFRNLSRQRRPGRPNGSVGRGGGYGDGGSPSVIAALGRAENDVATWARTLADDRGIVLPEADTEVEMFTALCSMFDTLLTTIATLEWAGEFVRDIGRHERNLRLITETTMPGWYAGGCNRKVTMEGDLCGTALYVVPGLTWVTCRICGSTTHAADHLETVLDEARGWVARPKALAEAIVALVDSEQSVEKLWARIRKWESLGWVEAHRRVDLDGDPVGPKRYRLGDVLDLTFGLGDAPTRPKRMTAS